jgi:hypothetical protein
MKLDGSPAPRIRHGRRFRALMPKDNKQACARAITESSGPSSQRGMEISRPPKNCEIAPNRRLSSPSWQRRPRFRKTRKDHWRHIIKTQPRNISLPKGRNKLLHSSNFLATLLHPRIFTKRGLSKRQA